jgi:hypothetical protein
MEKAGDGCLFPAYRSRAAEKLEADDYCNDDSAKEDRRRREAYSDLAEFS